MSRVQLVEQTAHSSSPHQDASDPRTISEEQYMSLLGERIRVLRERRNLTQKQAACAAGIATDMISRLENGRYLSPGLRTLFRIATGLETTISNLLPESNHYAVGMDLQWRDIQRRAQPEQMALIMSLAEQVLRFSRPVYAPGQGHIPHPPLHGG